MSTYSDLLKQYIRNPQLRDGLELILAEVPNGEKGETGATGAAGAKLKSVAWDGNDLVFTLTDDSAVTFSGAKVDLKGDTGLTGATIASVAWSDNDLVFTLEGGATVTLTGAKTTLKGETGADGANVTSVAWNGNDLVFTLDDSSTITLVNAKVDLKGETGAQGPGFEEDTPVNAVAASKKLEISGTANDGETVDVDDETYEVDSDGSVEEGNIAVNVSTGTKTQATAKLSFTGVIKQGDKFGIGEETWEADYGDGVEAGNKQLDLSEAASADFASAVFTLTDVVADGQTVGLGIYTFEYDTNDVVTEGNIKVGVGTALDKQSAAVALAAAIETALGDYFDAVASLSGSDWIVTVTAKIKGSVYEWVTAEDCTNGSWGGNLDGGDDAPADEAAVAFITQFNAGEEQKIAAVADGGTAIDFTADAGQALDGSKGNTIEVSTTTENANWGAKTKLEGGTDCTEAEVAAALILAINGSSAIVDASDGGSNDVTVTAKEKGAAGNDIDIATDMANASWAGAAVKLSGGQDGTEGTKGKVLFDGSYIYICTADNTINDANWKKAAIEAV
jgi:hypothetical protein